MEFLVVPQFTSSLIECFSGGGGECTYRDCKYTECTGIYIECEEKTCTIENTGGGCQCLGEKVCTCNGHIPVCVPRACTVKTCVRNYSINGT